MKTLLATIQGADIWLYRDDTTGAEIVEFIADMDIDCDGSGGNPLHDPYFQPATRLHYKGQPLHAETTPYVVVPPVVLSTTRGKVLGSKCEVQNINAPSFGTVLAVVGDSGPRTKIGEGSPALAEALGLSGNPNHGGTSAHIIRYRIYVGVPAQVNGITFDLQSA